MRLIPILVLLTILSDHILARVIVTACPKACECSGTTARCDVSDHTLAAVLTALPRNLTELNISTSGLTYLKKGAFRKFQQLVLLSVADNSIRRLQKGSLQGLTRLKELYVQNNGNDFTIDEETLEDTPELLKLHLEGNPSIISFHFLKRLTKLQEVLVDSATSCTRCRYTRTSGKESCRTPGYCANPKESPFGNGKCACAVCVTRIVSQNCTQEQMATSRLLGDSTATRIALWLISSLALASNLALIVSRCYTHTLRRKPLSIFISGIALSNLLVTTSVVILLVADANQSPKVPNTLGQSIWSHSICGPVYFLRHFGAYCLVFILCLLVMDRFIKLGYHRCFTSEITVRRSCLYICETWILAFLLIILPWTRVSEWHRMCTASYETTFAQVMHFISGCLVIGLCIFVVAQVAVLFWRLIRTDKLNMRKETRVDLCLILAAVLTFLLLGIPHSVVVFSHFAGATSPENGAEVITILLTVLCVLYPVLLVHYHPLACERDSLSSDTSCQCGKCKVDVHQNYPAHHSMDSIHAPKSCITLSSFQEGCNSKKYSTTITTTASIERMSVDSLVDLETWRSQSTKTKCWIESCDYDDLKKIRNQSSTQTAKSDNGSSTMGTKQRTLRFSDGNLGNSSSTSGVNDVSSAGSETTSSERASSFHEAIHEHAILESAPVADSTLDHKKDSDGGKTSDSKALKRLSSFRGLLQRALSPRRQRSKSLPEKGEIQTNKVERSQSVPSAAIPLDKNVPLPVHEKLAGGPPWIAICVSPEKLDQSAVQEVRGDDKERLASFFILAPARTTKTARKNMLSPRKARGEITSPSSPRKTSLADRIAKSFSLGRKSPSHDDSLPAKTITLEEGDILTELPVMRRTKIRPKPREPTARDSTCSTGSTGSTTTRFSLEWDPIGSVEGYGDHEVLPPYPPMSLNKDGVPPGPKFPRPLQVIQTSARLSRDFMTERNSAYSLDWDPTSVQLRNSLISRDSLSFRDLSDDEGATCDVGVNEDKKGTTVWV